MHLFKHVYIRGGETDTAGGRGVIVGGTPCPLVGLGLGSRDSFSLEKEAKAEGVDTVAGGFSVNVRKLTSDYCTQ